MSPAEALAPQPAPYPVPDLSKSVTDDLIADAHLDPVVRALLIERRKQGRRKYGTELMTLNGRHPGLDLLQEMVDALVYARQRAMQGKQSIDHARVSLLVAFVRDLALELGVEP